MKRVPRQRADRARDALEAVGPRLAEHHVVGVAVGDGVPGPMQSGRQPRLADHQGRPGPPLVLEEAGGGERGRPDRLFDVETAPPQARAQVATRVHGIVRQQEERLLELPEPSDKVGRTGIAVSSVTSTPSMSISHELIFRSDIGRKHCTVLGMGGMAYQRYVAIGNSPTEELMDPYPDGSGYRGWADRLAERMAAASPGLLYANLAVRGKLARQVHDEQLAAALALEPDFATVVAGLNDTLRPQCDLDATAGHLDAMIGALTGQGATVATMGSPRPSADQPAGAGGARPRVRLQRARARDRPPPRGAADRLRAQRRPARPAPLAQRPPARQFRRPRTHRRRLRRGHSHRGRRPRLGRTAAAGAALAGGHRGNRQRGLGREALRTVGGAPDPRRLHPATACRRSGRCWSWCGRRGLSGRPRAAPRRWRPRRWRRGSGS